MSVNYEKTVVKERIPVKFLEVIDERSLDEVIELLEEIRFTNLTRGKYFAVKFEVEYDYDYEYKSVDMCGTRYETDDEYAIRIIKEYEFDTYQEDMVAKKELAELARLQKKYGALHDI
jgi:tRNA U54 and U55 pseudouridine synthase Pus10